MILSDRDCLISFSLNKELSMSKLLEKIKYYENDFKELCEEWGHTAEEMTTEEQDEMILHFYKGEGITADDLKIYRALKVLKLV